MTCLYCHQPIYETETEPGYLGRLIHMRGKYRHVAMDELYCNPALIDPAAPLPACHICKTTTDHHKGFCSACGVPQQMARPE